MISDILSDAIIQISALVVDGPYATLENDDPKLVAILRALKAMQAARIALSEPRVKP